MRLSRRTPIDQRERRGVVLLGVLVVTVILALLAYQYNERMLAEYQASLNAHRTAQARVFADSGLHYAAAMIASPESIAASLNGNPYDNPDKFKDVYIPSMMDPNQAGVFSLIAPLDPDQPGSGMQYRCGVTDEGGKININAFMKRDSSGQELYDMLVKLPNMTPEIAASIVDWVDTDATPREGGAENDYYSGQTPGYGCKNGPLDSLDELLLVKGITREILYGADLNRNGLPDADEQSTGTSSDRGLSAFLTVASREPNRDSSGQAYINVNGDDLNDIASKLAPVVEPDLMKYLILYRQYGPSNSGGVQMSIGTSIAAMLGAKAPQVSNSQQGNLSEYQPDMTRKPAVSLNSLFDLVGSQVSVPGKDKKSPTKIYASPITDNTKMKEVLPSLYRVVSLSDDPETPARINVNTAPREVLLTIPDLTETDVDTIISTRPNWSGSAAPTPEFQSPVWLVTEANLKTSTVKNLEKSITTKSSVYHMQVIGRFANQTGPMSRVEAIVDANFGRPRIVLYRDWTELGRTKLP